VNWGGNFPRLVPSLLTADGYFAIARINNNSRLLRCFFPSELAAWILATIVKET
jgi:hypothetical protein